jgi:hypothetical protein
MGQSPLRINYLSKPVQHQKYLEQENKKKNRYNFKNQNVIIFFTIFQWKLFLNVFLKNRDNVRNYVSLLGYNVLVESGPVTRRYSCLKKELLIKSYTLALMELTN